MQRLINILLVIALGVSAYVANKQHRELVQANQDILVVWSNTKFHAAILCDILDALDDNPEAVIELPSATTDIAPLPVEEKQPSMTDHDRDTLIALLLFMSDDIYDRLIRIEKKLGVYPKKYQNHPLYERNDDEDP